MHEANLEMMEAVNWQIQELVVVHLRQYEHRSRVYELRVAESMESIKSMASTFSTTSINLPGVLMIKASKACSPS